MTNQHDSFAPGPPPLIDVAHLAELIETLGVDVVADVAEAFSGELDADFARLAAAADTDSVRSAAHGIAGSSAMVAMARLAAEMREIEASPATLRPMDELRLLADRSNTALHQAVAGARNAAQDQSSLARSQAR